MKINFQQANLLDPHHINAVVDLISHYMSSEMGGGEPLPEDLKGPLIDGLRDNPNTFVLLAELNGDYVGLATCFVNFSTFKAKPYINVHDIVVLEQLRGKGLGRQLLQAVIDIAKERGYCKITLEVRNDNQNAMHLYSSMGFADGEPPMLFWTKQL